MFTTYSIVHSLNYAAQRGRDAGEKRTHATGVHPLLPAVLAVAISLAAQDRAVAEGGKAPVSPCEPLCAILLRKASVYPLSLVKANVGRLCEKLKSAMRSGLKQRCNGNFLAIFVEVDLGEKSNFTGRFSGR